MGGDKVGLSTDCTYVQILVLGIMLLVCGF